MPRLFFSTLLLIPTVASQLACLEYGSGNQATNALPCFPDAQISHCCALTDICYSNSLCKTTANGTYTSFFIGLCTDPDTPSPECAAERFCKEDQNSDGTGITDCGDGQYCCYGLGGCDCNNSTQIFSLPGGTIVTTLPATVPPFTASSTSSTPATGSATTTPTSSPTNPPHNNDSNNNDSNAIPIGVGVGVGVGAVIVIGAAAVWFFMRRRKRARGTNVAAAPPEQQSFIDNTYAEGNSYARDNYYPSDVKYGNEPTPAKQFFPEAEAAQASGPYQLDATGTTHELPANGR